MSSRAGTRKANQADADITIDRKTKRIERTLVDDVVHTTRGDILAGRHPPGGKLAISSMAHTHKVSISVMREALICLVAEDLVTSESRQGFRVIEATIEDLEDTTELLRILMATATRHAVANGNTDWEASLLASHHRFRRAIEEAVSIGRTAAVDQAHSDFFSALTSTCRNTRLLKLLGSLRQSQSLYHRMAVTLLKDQAAALIESYDMIVKFAIARDVDSALRLLMEDINLATAACRERLSI